MKQEPPPAQPLGLGHSLYNHDYGTLHVLFITIKSPSHERDRKMRTKIISNVSLINWELKCGLGPQRLGCLRCAILFFCAFSSASSGPGVPYWGGKALIGSIKRKMLCTQQCQMECFTVVMNISPDEMMGHVTNGQYYSPNECQCSRYPELDFCFYSIFLHFQSEIACSGMCASVEWIHYMISSCFSQHSYHYTVFFHVFSLNTCEISKG